MVGETVVQLQQCCLGADSVCVEGCDQQWQETVGEQVMGSTQPWVAHL